MNKVYQRSSKLAVTNRSVNPQYDFVGVVHHHFGAVLRGHFGVFAQKSPKR